MVAIGLYAGARSKKLTTGVLATVLALVVSDAVLGFYRGMVWVYLATLVPVLLGRLIKTRSSVGAIAAAGLASSLAFFFITNFAVWAGGSLYPHTAHGLQACFAAAIPFYRNQILGDALYTAALFGTHALLTRFLRQRLQTA